MSQKVEHKARKIQEVESPFFLTWSSAKTFSGI